MPTGVRTVITVPPHLSAESTVQIVFDAFLGLPGRKPSTKKKFRDKFKLFLEQHGEKPISAITNDLIESWFLYLEEKKGYSEGNLAFHQNCFNTFFNFSSRLTGNNPTQILPRYSDKPRQIITAKENDLSRTLLVCEQLSLSNSASERRDAAIFALGTTGLRRSNIEHCRLSDAQIALNNIIRHDGQDMCLLYTKGKEPMEAVLDTPIANILRRYLEKRPSTRHDRLFIVLDQKSPHYSKPLSTEGFQRARLRICKRADVPLICFKKMRRLLGTKVGRTKGAEVGARVLGHRSGVRVFIDHYFDPDKEAARVAALEAHLQIRPSGRISA